MHDFYPLKPTAPSIPLKDDPLKRQAPSLSPDILIGFNNAPLQPYFGDFVASSPSSTNRLRHGDAAQLKFTEKLQHYSKHHEYPSRVCYPLAFERSGYLHPVFDDFIVSLASAATHSHESRTVTSHARVTSQYDTRESATHLESGGGHMSYEPAGLFRPLWGNGKRAKAFKPTDTTDRSTFIIRCTRTFPSQTVHLNL